MQAPFHNRGQDPIKPVVVAHRGASADAPENTLEAFQLAWQQGADAIEGDFHITRDNQIVCRHDAAVRLDRHKNVSIRDISYEDLKSIPEEQVVPTLKDVLDTVPTGKGIFIEIKCGPEIIEPLLESLDRSKLSCQQVTIISFNEQVIAALKQAAPKTLANWLVDFKGSVLKLRPGSRAIIKTLENLEADGVGIKADPRVSTGFIREIQSAGFAVHVWTVDSPFMARRFHKAGVDSITTNVPAKIRTSLNSNLLADSQRS